MRVSGGIYSSPQCNISSAYNKCLRYMRKMFKFDQMDFQFAAWQMFYLFVSPQKLIKLFRARKFSKSQYARDDPAFLVLFAAVLCVTSTCLAYFGLGLSIGKFFLFLLYVIFVDCLGVGLMIATFFWFITNTFMKQKSNPQDVEWAYCFDIHLNAFFPPLVILHFIQLFFESTICRGHFFGLLIGNSFWLSACVYYFYITFLGYNALQILENLKYFLVPIPCVFIVYILSLCINWNVTEMVWAIYKYRVW